MCGAPESAIGQANKVKKKAPDRAPQVKQEAGTNAFVHVANALRR
jgi:hypothetical protein